MAGSSSRRKGQRGEREAAKLFSFGGYPDARRGDSQSRGAREADVEDTPFWVEVKIGKRPRIRAAIDQAERDCDHRPPIVVWRDDRSEWRVDCSLDLFLEMCDAKGT